MPLLISGIVASIAGLILLFLWGGHLLAIIKAVVPLAFLGVGVVLTYLGYEEYREAGQAAKNAAKLLNPEPGPQQGPDGPIIEVSPNGEAGLSARAEAGDSPPDGSAPQNEGEQAADKKAE